MLLAVEKEKIDFTPVEVHAEPFDYFTLTQAFNDETSLIVLDWLETDAPWKLVEADFYTQYEFDLENIKLPEYIFFLNQRGFLDYLIREFERIFSVKLAQQVDITAHKLIKGHTIRLHNDYIPGQETHRLLIQLNRNWRDENGGFLIFFNSSDPKDIHRVIRPAHNSSAGFAISQKSNHAVSTIHNGERYTLVYSFYAAGSTD
jgi:Rps23 Pro-64 3,4-dihydroxylase Tpa1-like proline 4-hydroxylase